MDLDDIQEVYVNTLNNAILSCNTALLTNVLSHASKFTDHSRELLFNLTQAFILTNNTTQAKLYQSLYENDIR